MDASATPPGRSAPKSRVFSAATPATSRRASRWAGPTLWITAMSGSAMAASGAISPGAEMPSSMTQKRSVAAASSMDSGRPMRLL